MQRWIVEKRWTNFPTSLTMGRCNLQPKAPLNPLPIGPTNADKQLPRSATESRRRRSRTVPETL